jgi:GPI mannosyltransferase 4
VSNVRVGAIYGWPSYKTWEFTSEHPIRSVFPLWLVYGPSLLVYKWICEGLGYEAAPCAVFYVLRSLMFTLSFVLEDWAIYELLPVKRERAVALMLVASSYVTWTYQMHTFSNSIETLVVLWCLVMMCRMKDDTQHTQVRLCVALAFLGVLGIFNRITFPAFIIVAGIQLLPHLFVKPLRIPIMLLAAAATALVAVRMDSEYYTGARLRFRDLPSKAIITPWNNLIYNIDTSNLAAHGLHPFWQHFAANLPQLIGPAFPLLLFSSDRGTLFWSGIIGIAVLSCFQHQEARFLLPAVPLLLASVKLPSSHSRLWICLWMTFNILAAILFGLYHQAGVIPVQTWIGQQPGATQVFWWKTYSPPRWLLGTNNSHIITTDLMGMPVAQIAGNLSLAAPCAGSAEQLLLVAPSNAHGLEPNAAEPYTPLAFSTNEAVSRMTLSRKMQHQGHVGLDDLDFGDDGVWPTLKRVIGGRGITVWQVSKQCEP